MRRDEIRVFRGDVENHIQRLRAFSPQILPVEFDEPIPSAIIPVNVLNYSPRFSWRHFKPMLCDIADGAPSAVVSMTIICAMAAMTTPWGEPALRWTFTILSLLFPGLWLAWESMRQWTRSNERPSRGAR